MRSIAHIYSQGLEMVSLSCICTAMSAVEIPVSVLAYGASPGPLS